MRDWESAGELEMAGYVSLFSFTRTLWIWRNLSPWLASHFRSIIFSVSPFFCFSFALLSVVLLLCSSPVIFFVFTTPLFPSFVLHLLFVVRHILRLPLFPLPWPQPRPSACTRFILPSRGSRRGRGRGGGRRPGCLVSHFRCIRPPCVLKFFF